LRDGAGCASAIGNWFFQPLRKKIFLKIRRRRSRQRSSTWKIDATKLEFVGVEIQQ